MLETTNLFIYLQYIRKRKQKHDWGAMINIFIHFYELSNILMSDLIRETFLMKKHFIHFYGYDSMTNVYERSYNDVLVW